MPPFKNGVHHNVTVYGTDCKLVRLPYVRYSAGPLRGKYLHRHLMEQKLGRRLRRTETVHHIDGNTLNNAIENLQVLTWRQHGKISRMTNRGGRVNAD